MTIGNKKQRKISTEELARTQVLNLEDVQKLANYEKIISKKPALMVALVGLFSIIVGVSAQTVVSLSAMNESNVQPSVSNRVQTEEVKKVYDTLVCEQTEIDPIAEINIKMTFAINYDEQQAVDSYTKTVDVTPTSTTSINALTSIQNGIVGFKVFENQRANGYKVVVSNKETGYEVLTTIDPKVLDISQLDQATVTNKYVAPDIGRYSPKQDVTALLTSLGYTCK